MIADLILFGMLMVFGYTAWLLFNAWLMIRRERESKQRLGLFQEAAERLEQLQEEQEL